VEGLRDNNFLNLVGLVFIHSGVTETAVAKGALMCLIKHFFARTRQSTREEGMT
jgi:hypothetical protein